MILSGESAREKGGRYVALPGISKKDHDGGTLRLGPGRDPKGGMKRRSGGYTGDQALVSR